MSQSTPASPPSASAPGSSLIPDWTDVITTTHLVFIAVFAVLAVVAIVYGVRLRRRQHQARDAVAEHNDALPDTPAPERGEVEAPPSAPPSPAPAPTGEGSLADGPVTQLKGLGPKVAERLAQLGITTVGQIAALTDDDAATLDAQLGPFAGRMARDRWLEQARFLAAGDRKGFESVFGRL